MKHAPQEVIVATPYYPCRRAVSLTGISGVSFGRDGIASNPLKNFIRNYRKHCSAGSMATKRPNA
jgi:hypothetical protein